MNLSGTLTVDTPTGQVTLNANDFQEDGYQTGPEVEISHEQDEWSVKKIFGGGPGIGDGDWETESCSIVSDNIKISYHEDEEE